jgi:hypothetical protein
MNMYIVLTLEKVANFFPISAVFKKLPKLGSRCGSTVKWWNGYATQPGQPLKKLHVKKQSPNM